MSELVLNLNDFEEAIDIYVPSYQRKDILKIISREVVNEGELEDFGLTLTGEKSPEGLFVPTGSPNDENKGEVWRVIKKSTYQYFCGKFDSDNGSSIKDIVAAVSVSVCGILDISQPLLSAAVIIAVYSVYKIGKNTWCELNSSILN